jgi:hypothetical protein
VFDAKIPQVLNLDDLPFLFAFNNKRLPSEMIASSSLDRRKSLPGRHRIEPVDVHIAVCRATGVLC